jgi:hypothetical protein
MRRWILFLLFGVGLLPSIAKAEEAQVAVHLSGIGATTCAHWRSSAATRAEGTVWIFGFWSALNYVAAASEQPQPSSTEKEVLAEVARICLANPSQVLASAAWTAYLNVSKK